MNYLAKRKEIKFRYFIAKKSRFCFDEAKRQNSISNHFAKTKRKKSGFLVNIGNERYIERNLLQKKVSCLFSCLKDKQLIIVYFLASFVNCSISHNFVSFHLRKWRFRKTRNFIKVSSLFCEVTELISPLFCGIFCKIESTEMYMKRYIAKRNQNSPSLPLAVIIQYSANTRYRIIM